MHKNIKYSVIVGGVALLAGPLMALAQWTPAPANPPASNVAAPINVGASNQIKSGGLEVASFISDGGAVIMGNTGIGTAAPNRRLHVTGGDVRLQSSSLYFNDSRDTWGVRQVMQDYGNGMGLNIDTSDGAGVYANAMVIRHSNGSRNVGIGVTAPGYKLQVGAAGDGTSVGANAYFYISDRSLKTDIKPLSGALDSILKLQGVSFDWRSTGEPSVGLVAQDVERVYPELVNTDRATGLKSVQYGNLVAPLIEAVKEQQKEIEALRAEVESLKQVVK